jgi:hypothetical protein
LTFAAVAVEQGLPELVFEPSSIGFCILAAIAARRVLFDPAGFATETDRPTDVVDPATLSDGEHFIASRSLARSSTPTRKVLRSRRINEIPWRMNSRRTLRSRS